MNKLLSTTSYASLKLPALICAAILLSACVSNDIVIVESTVKQIKELNDPDQDGVIDDRDTCDGTTRGALVENDGCGEDSIEVKTFDIDVKFADGSSEISEIAHDKIEKLANFLKMFPQSKVQIDGHTSKVGSADSNQILSDERANKVVDVLVNNFDIARDRLTPRGFGFDDLEDNRNTPTAHAINRRMIASLNESIIVEKMIWTIYTVD